MVSAGSPLLSPSTDSQTVVDCTIVDCTKPIFSEQGILERIVCRGIGTNFSRGGGGGGVRLLMVQNQNVIGIDASSSFNKYFIDMAIEPAGPDDVFKSYTKDALPVIRTYTANQQMKLWIDDSLTEGEKGKQYMLLADIVGKPIPTGEVKKCGTVGHHVRPLLYDKVKRVTARTLRQQGIKTGRPFLL